MFWNRSNSILLYFDPVGMTELEEALLQIQEVGRFYSWVPLSQTLERLHQRKNVSGASIVLGAARKGTVLQLVPQLVGQNIPFTMMLDGESVGLNRLPLTEELELLQRQYPDRFSAEELKQWREKVWLHPEEAENFLIEFRKNIGPLDLNTQDPLRYFSTWGKLKEIPPDLVEWGWAPQFNPGSPARWMASINYLGTQMGRAPRVLLLTAAHSVPFSLGDLGFQGRITLAEGAINKTTPPFELPIWKLRNA